MEHSFDIEVAKRFGVNAAIIFKNIYHWVDKNRANERNFHDGRYWTYNSVKAFHELFPYLSEKQIRTALNLLIDEGVILTGNYNSQPYDRTLWYSVSDEWEGAMKSTIPSAQKDDSICPLGKMDVAKKQNESSPEGEPIPDIKPFSNVTDKKQYGNTDGGQAPTRTRKPKEPKQKYGEYGNVLLTVVEMDKLREEYGEAETGAAIEYLDAYIEEKGTKYKSHYLTLRRWVFDAVKERNQRQRKAGATGGRLPNGGYDWENL